VHLQQRQEQVELNFENRSPGFSTWNPWAWTTTSSIRNEKVYSWFRW
jgi:hypothetical protein